MGAMVPIRSRTAPTARDEISRLERALRVVARKVGPTVVAIEAIKPAPPAARTKPVEESGSGVLVRVAGQRGIFVLTNNHVIQQAPPRADHRQPGRRPHLHSRPQVWADPESDMALLRLDGATTCRRPRWATATRVRVGQWVLAFGSPFGLNQTVTHGIISARERGQVSLGSTIRIKDFLQTDAAINPGSSGGPLVNLDGEVIGINTAIASHSGSNSGVAFSIPINLVKRVVAAAAGKGQRCRAATWACSWPRRSRRPTRCKLGLDRAQGRWWRRSIPTRRPRRPGCEPNDVVLQVDGVAIRNENHFINLISAMPPGQRVRLQVWRERGRVALDAVVGDWAKGQGRLQP